MILMLFAACALIFAFWQLMSVCLSHDLEWDISPLALLFLITISIRRRWLA